MPAIDTVYTFVANPGAGPTATATAPAPGDSLQVRSFSAPASAYLEQMIRRGVTAGYGRVRSPRLHDNQTGINVYGAEVVHTLGLPNQLNQPLYSADNLITEMSGGAAETDALVLINSYTQLDGISARLAMWGDISNMVKNTKAFQVAAPAGANTWTDTAITATENQLHADAYYAVLGYNCSASVACVAFKSPETGDLRVGGPGSTVSLDTADWFLRFSRDSNTPAIPIFAANNRGAAYVSAVDVAAVGGLIVTLICAELSGNPSV
jgi:hypothetical protein